MSLLLTGSRVYGTPRVDSDLDVVVLVSQDDMERMCAVADEVLENYDGHPHARFGKLDMIFVTDPAMFIAWETATNRCKDLAPITRERAIVVINDEFNRVGRRGGSE